MQSEGFFGNDSGIKSNRKGKYNEEQSSFEDYGVKSKKSKKQDSKRSQNDSNRMNSTGRAVSKRQSIIQSILEESDGSAEELVKQPIPPKKGKKNQPEIKKKNKSNHNKS